MRKIFPALLMLLAGATQAANNGFIANAGLWQTQYLTQPAPKKPTPPQWTCIDDDPQGWVSFTQWSALRTNAQCQYTGLSHTASSISWKEQCPSKTITGKLSFDSTNHFTGDAQVQEKQHGKLVTYNIHAEGRHHAACTTPAD